jgi:photosystem II stability/assembly factor-like uncharacterized protein
MVKLSKPSESVTVTILRPRGRYQFYCYSPLAERARQANEVSRADEFGRSVKYQESATCGKNPENDSRWDHLTNGLSEETDVHAITVHPDDPAVVYIGTRSGPYPSTDRGDHWERLGFPDPVAVWPMLIDPNNPRTLYAGTSPVAVYRSDDGGDNWRRLTDPRMPDRVKMPFACRVMRLAIAPDNPGDLFATLEVNGAMRSRDGGESWEDSSAGLVCLGAMPCYKSRIASDTEIEGMLDGHALCVSSAAPDAVFLAVRMGLFRSADRGASWQDMEIGRFAPFTYARDIRVSPQDPRTMYACVSPAAISADGSIFRSHDLGETWARFDHSVKADATMMGVALHPRDPDQVYGASRVGQVFGTQDGGRTWHEYRLPQGCRDVYAIACG